MNDVIVLAAVAVVVSAAGVVAVTANRFRKVPAGVVALGAAVCPWLIILAFQGRLQGGLWVALGMFGSAPLYGMAFFLYGMGSITTGRRQAAAAALVGMFAGGGNTLLWFHILSKME